MAGSEILKGIAETAVAFIGFSSIVTALRRGKDQPWSYQEKIGLMLLGILTFGTVLLAYLPFPLYYMTLEDWQIYSISGWAFTAYGVFVFLFLVILNLRKGRTTRVPKVFNLFFMLSLAVLVAMILLGLGRFSQGMLGIYMFGLFWLLVIASVQFIVFLLFIGDIEPRLAEKLIEAPDQKLEPVDPGGQHG